MRAGQLDRKVQFWRADRVDDGFTKVDKWSKHGPAQPAARADMSDGERMRAGQITAHMMTRFTVRWNTLTSHITPADRLECEGRMYDIVGIKELVGSRRRWFEITASARVD